MHRGRSLRWLLLAGALAGCHELFSFSHTGSTADAGPADLGLDAPLSDQCPAFAPATCQALLVYPPPSAPALVVSRPAAASGPATHPAVAAVGRDFYVAFEQQGRVGVAKLPNCGCPVLPQWNTKPYGEAGARAPTIVFHPQRTMLAIAWVEGDCPNELFLYEQHPSAPTGPHHLDAALLPEMGYGPPGLLPVGEDYLYYGHVRWTCPYHVKPVVARLTADAGFAVPYEYSTVDPWVSSWAPAVALHGEELIMLRLYAPDGQAPADGAMAVYLDGTTLDSPAYWTPWAQLATAATTDPPRLVTAGGTLWGAWGQSASTVGIAMSDAPQQLQSTEAPGSAPVIVALGPTDPPALLWNATALLLTRAPAAGRQIRVQTLQAVGGEPRLGKLAVIHDAPPARPIGRIAAVTGAGGVGVTWEEADQILFRFITCQ